MKTGAPKHAVKIPIGTSSGRNIDRAITSAQTITTAPIKPVNHNMTACRDSPINLAMCGITSPIKPIIPAIETVTAIANDDIKTTACCIFSVDKPKCCASSLPKSIKSNS